MKLNRIIKNNIKNQKLFCPNNGLNFNYYDAVSFFNNFLIEIRHISFSKEEILLLEKVLFKNLLTNKNNYFYYHFAPIAVDVVKSLFKENALIVELGCGSGTLSLILAILGANVIGVDINKTLINACIKRKEFYEKHFGKLNIEFYCSDAVNFKLNDLNADSVFSVHALNTMEPIEKLVKNIYSYLKKGGKLFICDFNVSCVYNIIFKKRKYLPPEIMRRKLEHLGFSIKKIYFQYFIPPQIVKSRKIMLSSILIDRVIGRFKFTKVLGPAYTIIAEKQ